MIEQPGDLFSFAKDNNAICITTNGNYYTDRNSGKNRAIMGGGVAYHATIKYPGIDFVLGDLLAQNGNVTQVMWTNPNVIAYPTKDEVQNPSTVERIKISTEQLIKLADKEQWTNIYLPAWPGCGLGALAVNLVEPLLKSMLDDRFVVVSLDVSELYKQEEELFKKLLKK